MRSDTKQALMLLVVCGLCLVLVAVAYFDRNQVLRITQDLQREVELYQAEREGMKAEPDAGNPYLMKDSAKAMAWEAGHEK